MASESGGKKAASFSCMKLPSLTKQIQKILSDYPDGGQIIKELIQNAEDAGATKIILVCDERDLTYSRRDDQTEDFRKFFEGPALCVYNNALFQPKDWEGIRMIDISVKEGDRLKVGRFGQGFKSVFHLTDYPCVLSGDKMLCIDPQQQRDRVNAMLDINTLHEYEGIEMDAFFNAFDGAFGVTRDLTLKGAFDGTIFRFPLRRIPSKLNSNTYTKVKLLELFKIFENEASSTLLFLKNLDVISICSRTTVDGLTALMDVTIANIEDIKHSRNIFNQTIRSLPSNYDGDPEVCSLNLRIEYKNYKNGKTQERLWLVIHYFIGGNASNDFKLLINDPELQLCPYVGIAAPIGESTDKLDGHVFCFLPLPKEGTKLTGLSVHVNGYFALNQSRHHVRWAADGQTGSRITEKAVRWNYKLVEEALPDAYSYWFQKAIEYSNQNANDEKIVSAIHHAYPDTEAIQSNWYSMLNPLFNRLRREKIIFSLTRDQWISVQTAYIIMEATPEEADAMDTVIKAARVLDINCVVLDNDCYNALSRDTHYHALSFSPSVLANHLRPKTFLLSTFNDAEKMHILKYLLTDTDNAILDKLPLLPLQSGKWTTFERVVPSFSSHIFMASTERMLLCPGIEEKFIRQTPPLPGKLKQQIEDICNTGLFQIRLLQLGDLESLLDKLIQTLLPSKRKRLKSSPLSLKWLKVVWQYMLENNRVSICQSIPLFPMLEGRSLDDPDVILVCLTKNMLLREKEEECVPEDILCCFTAIGIDVITSLPPWIPLPSIEPFVQYSDPSGIQKVLDAIVASGTLHEKITAFNCCTGTSRLAFMQYMAQLRGHFTRNVYTFLRKLEMFQEKTLYNGAPILTSVNKTDRFTQCENWPIRYPVRCVDGYEENQRHMLKQLDCKPLELHEMFRLTFNAINGPEYTVDDVVTVMKYFVTQYHTLQYLKHIQFPLLVNMAKQIPFLLGSCNLKKPADLFNPNISKLQKLFLGQEKDKFPIFAEQPDQEFIDILHELGLKVEHNVTASDLLQVAILLDEWSQSSHFSEENIRTKSNALIQHLILYPEILKHKCEEQTLQTLLENINCIEYNRNRPPSYPSGIPWFKQQNILCKPKEATCSRFSSLIGAVIPSVTNVSYELETAFRWNEEPIASQVICQLVKISESYTDNGSVDLVVLLGHLYTQLCQYSEQEFKELENKTIVWNCESFSRPTEVVINKTRGDLDLKPYLHFLPDIFQENKNFFEKAGCHKHQSVYLLIQTLSMMKNQMSQNQACNDVQDIEELASKIVRKLAHRKDEIPIGSEILIPLRIDGESSFVLVRISDCTYIGNPEDISIGDKNMSVYLVYDGKSEKVARGIPSQHAIALGVKTKRQQLAGKISKGIPFGQKEDLIERLKGLLRAYPRDESVLKELLQNADDAGATELNFIKDYRTHIAEGVFIEEAFYGPALCVFNNSYFTENDLKGIQKLGYGGKRVDLTTIGQYGVGFNAVYHLTDTPSFISKGPQLNNGGVLCIFDPTCQHIKNIDKTEPGMRFNIKDVIEQDFQRELLGFSESDVFQDGTGTMFRFPLRMEQSKLSEEVVNIEIIDKMLRTFTDDLKETLLFLKNVKCIKISDITSGELRTEYSISSSMSATDSQKKTEFNRDVGSWAEQASSTQVASLQSTTQYILTLSDTVGFEKTWLVVQKLGTSLYPDHIFDELQRKTLVHLPVGGIALPILDFKDIAQKAADSLSDHGAKTFAQKNSYAQSKHEVNANAHTATAYSSDESSEILHKTKCSLSSFKTTDVAQPTSHYPPSNEENGMKYTSTNVTSNFATKDITHSATSAPTNIDTKVYSTPAADEPSIIEMKGTPATSTYFSSNIDTTETTHQVAGYPSRLKTTYEPLKGNAFAVLPLPVRTGLAFHVNGHFSLDHESRRDLWKEGTRLQWNEFLRQHVIVPCLVKAILYFKQFFTRAHKSHVVLTSWTQMNTLMWLYHTTFPLMDGVTDKFWQHLVKDFYEYVYTNECLIFPVITEDDSKTLVTEWVPLNSTTRTYNAVFNTFSKDLGSYILNIDPSDFERDRVLEKALKMLGMQLVQTPKLVFETIRKCKIQESFGSYPSFVITFLSTYQDETDGACVVGKIGCDVSSTSYLTVSNVKAIINHIRTADDFCSKCTGLPIIVTADDVVRECSKEHPVYNSKYSDLLPHSKDSFLHTVLQPLLCGSKLYDMGILKALDIPAFLEMLPHSAPTLHQDSIILWTKESEDPVSQSWLLRVYKLLHEQSLEKASDGTECCFFNHKRFRTNFEYFEGWAIVPCKRKGEYDQIYELVPADKAFSVFCSTNSDIVINEIFKRLNIPKLDKLVFQEKDSYRSDLVNPIKKYLATVSNPYEILQCLLFYSESRKTNTVSSEDALKLLAYFERNLGQLPINQRDLQRKLRSLPLHNTLINTVTSMTDWHEVVVVKKDPCNKMPSAGIEQWMYSTKILIILHSEKVEQLYSFLKLKTISLTELYIQYLFDKYVKIPSYDLLKHIEYVKDSLVHPELDGKFSRQQERLINLLNGIPFISVKGCMKKANELFDDEVRLFRLMLDESKFPPEAFRTKKWKPFLLCIGLTKKATQDHILEFADCIETEGKYNMNDTLFEKSKLVLQRFAELYKSVDETERLSDITVQKIRTIRFIFPKKN